MPRRRRRPPKPLLWAADAEGGGALYLLGPQRPQSLHRLRSPIWPRRWRRKSAGPLSSFSTTSRRLCRACNAGDFDFAMNGLEVTPEREKALRFSRPYYIYTEQLVVRRDDNRIETPRRLQAAGSHGRHHGRNGRLSTALSRWASRTSLMAIRPSRFENWNSAGSTPCCWTCRLPSIMASRINI